jgi:hypothetical protein
MTRAQRIGFGLFGVLAVISIGTISCSPRPDNGQIVSEVQNRIRADRRLMMARFQVTAANHIITLAGYVASDDQRVAAVQDAWRVDGVKVVVDNLRLSDSSRLTMTVLEPQAWVAGTVQAPMAPKARSSEGVSSPDNLHRPGPSETAAAGLSSKITSSVSSVNIVSAPSDTHLVDSNVPSVSASASSPPIPVATSSRAPQQVTVPYGSVLPVRLTESLSSDLNEKGDTFLASLASPFLVGNTVVIPEGAAIQGRIVEVQNAGRFSGKAALVIEATRLGYNGKTYDLHTSQYSKQGPSRSTGAAAKIGGGAGLGAILGAILGGGKGAAIGAVIGAGTGTGVQAATKGATVQLPAESMLSFRLEAPITVMPSSTLQGMQSSDTGPSSDPFSSDDRPVLKRRPGSPPQD